MRNTIRLDYFRHISVIAFTALLLLPAELLAMSKNNPGKISHPAVSSVSGEVSVKARGQSIWEPVEKGTLLLAGDFVRSGPEGRVRISFASGNIWLFENGELQIPSTGERERKKDIRELVIIKGTAFMDINMDGEAGTFRFKTQYAYGKARNSRFTVSSQGGKTVFNVYAGEANVSKADAHGEIASSLIPGTSMILEDGAGLSRMVRFDPRSAMKSYSRKIFPDLDPTTGLPAKVRETSFERDRESPLVAFSNVDRGEDHKREVDIAVVKRDLPDDENQDVIDGIDKDTDSETVTPEGVVFGIVPDGR